MRVDHIALWVQDLEGMRVFYENYFQAVASSLYVNDRNGFKSYFLSFPDSDTRLEIMTSSQLIESGQNQFLQGYAHLAISLGSRGAVDSMTALFQKDGYQVVDGPRITGDGYYESVILDPELNRLELTI
jgi:lactoylglutathione lyase